MGYSLFTHITSGKWGSAYNTFIEDTKNIEGLHDGCSHIDLADVDETDSIGTDEYFTVFWISAESLNQLSRITTFEKLADREWLLLVTDIDPSTLSLEERWYFDFLSGLAETVLNIDFEVSNDPIHYISSMSALITRLANTVKGIACIDYNDVRCTAWGYQGMFDLVYLCDVLNAEGLSSRLIRLLRTTENLVGVACDNTLSVKNFTTFADATETNLDKNSAIVLSGLSIDRKSIRYSPLLCMTERLSGTDYRKIYNL